MNTLFDITPDPHAAELAGKLAIRAAIASKLAARIIAEPLDTQGHLYDQLESANPLFAPPAAARRTT